jgi:NAD(P)-dependent dehydrogenase (short-subunit alcohol dehydrogenase family)
MTDSLNGKVALVTGASSGMGKSTAIAFGAAGAKVVVAARRQPEGEATVQAIRDASGEAVFIQTDVTSPDQVEAMVDGAVGEFGRLDYAFNNAGGGGASGLLHELTIDEWDLTADIYLKSVWLCMKFEIAHMLKHGAGAIVNSSVLGLKGVCTPDEGYQTAVCLARLSEDDLEKRVMLPGIGLRRRHSE